MNYDVINFPKHHVHGGIETLDFIEAKGLDKDHCLANVIKYVARHAFKNGIEDLEKARFYLDRRINQLKAEDIEKQATRNALDAQMKRLAENNRTTGAGENA